MSAATGYGKEPEPSTSSSVQLSQQCRHFELSDILLATENFDESLVIGKGGFGKVYIGTIFNGSATVLAAIKRLDPSSNQGAPEFWAEVEMLSKLRHCNLVSLHGYCNHKKEMILVYEYMPNGTLEDHLHKLGTPLSWVQRLKICIGAGRGLHYLHTGTGIDVGVIHGDVKTSNILLQESWAAKISDFGLSKIGPINQPSTCVNTLVKGTFGYFDPNYYATGKLTRKSDVYAFGVVLLEVLCRKRAVFDIDEEAFNLAIWAQESIKEGNLKNIIDSDIRGQISPKCSKDFVRITEKCLHSSPKERSTMVEVLFNLESILNLQEKLNNSEKPAHITIFYRVSNMLTVPFNRKNTAQGVSKPSSEGKSTIGTNTAGADNNTFLDTSELPTDHEARSLKFFEFDDLKKATKNFSPDMLLGEGGFGQVYLGWVDQNTFAPSKQGVGVPVAVKRCNHESMQGLEEWQAEVSFLGRFAHPNIINLLGYNSNRAEFLLVYEYMANKSFDGFLFTNGHNAPNTAEPLSWGTRLTIMIGVARGLTYLHSSQNQVMYRDVKASNILLDKDFTAKLADFGLAKSSPKIGKTHVTTRVMGTYGYAAPEYVSTGHLYVKSDIYGFGVVLLETLTGLRVVDPNRPPERQNLVDWVRPILVRKRTLKTIMDPRLEQNYPLEGAFKCAALASRCLENQPKYRPSSKEVLQSLEEIRVVYNQLAGPGMPAPLITSTLQAAEEPPAQEPLSIAELLQINPETLPLQQKFTTEAVIMTIEENRGWYMNRCKTCNQSVEEASPHWHCHKPGTPVVPNYSYCLRAIIADVTGSLLLTCYSPEAHSLLPPITELLSYVPDRDPYKIPSIIKDLEHTKHKFTLHFAEGSRIRYPRFILDDAKDADPPILPPSGIIQPLPPLLPAPPVKTQSSSSTTTPNKDAQITSAGVSSAAVETPTTETTSTEILLETLTPPPALTEAGEKKNR